MSAWENYRLEWSPDPLSTSVPTWTDITSYALAASGGQAPIATQTGVPPEGTSTQYATLAVDLDNTDHRFTFGNTSSPYYPNWKPGRRIRLYEVIGNRRFDLFSGYLNAPENQDWADKGIDQTVQVTAVDRLGWIGAGRSLVSTLAEHILYNSSGTLLAYYPLGDPGPTYRPIVNTGGFPALAETQASSNVAANGTATYAAQGGTTLPGDDLRPPRFGPLLVVVGSPPYTLASETNLQTYLFDAPQTTTNATVTVACWATPDPASVDAIWEPLQIFFGWNNGLGSGTLILRRTASNESPPNAWKAGFNDLGASWSANAWGSAPELNKPVLLAARVEMATSKLTLFVNGQSYAGSVSGSFPSKISFLQFVVGSTFTGSVGHIQIHQSTASDDYTQTTQQAQYAMGTTGLAGQFAGERVKTLARYVGVPATELSYVDNGTAVMQKATLAGANPLDEMRIAETAEQGRLRTNGQGLIVFDARTRRYNA